MACWKVHGRLSIRRNWTFPLSIMVPEIVYSSAVFAGVDLFALKFYPDIVVLHQPFLLPEN